MAMATRMVLRDKLSKLGYNNPDSAAKDINLALNAYRGLVPAFDTFVFNDGSERKLCKIQGTIPVPYKGQTYNIPICIWLMDSYPYNAPLCYVKPTSDMVVKVSRVVDNAGKIYLPILHFWQPKASDLLNSLIQSMIAAFAVDCPVYAKPKEVRVEPEPTPEFQSANYFANHPTFKNMAPYKPPQPTSGMGYSAPYPPTNSYPGMPNPYPGSYGQFPPMPPSGNQLPYPAYPPYPGGPSVTPTPSAQNSGIDSGTGTITEEHIRASLLSAVEDKIRRVLREQVSRAHDELQILKQTESELREGTSKLDSILARLSKEQEELDKNISMLKDKEEELSKATERLSDQEVDVDEAVTTTAPLYKQILQSYAEEAALEDAIYYIGEALRRGVIDLDVFLKQVRSLSRKQFMLRALMQKCRQKAGLK